MLLFSFFLNIFLCQGYELSGEIALKNNHYYYMLRMALAFEVKLKRRMDGRKNIDEAE